MSSSQNSKNEIFNSKLFISPLCYDSPHKGNNSSETNDDSNCFSCSASSKANSKFSSEKKKGEKCLMNELLSKLDECSPVKNESPYSKEKNYLLESYYNKAEKENVNVGNLCRQLHFGGGAANPGSSAQEEGKKKKGGRKFNKNLVRREGDWNCLKCKNVNFGFRKVCNKCGVSKKESEKEYNIIASNLISMLSK